jgi:hypothetical protein
MFNKYFIGVSQILHGGRLSFIGNLEVDASWQIHWMISLILIRLFRGLQFQWGFAKLESDRTLVGAIKLNKEEALLVSQTLHGRLGLDEAL